jgi:hypothetical protein
MRVCIVGEAHPAIRMAGVEYQLELLADEICRRPGVDLIFIGRHVPTGPAAEKFPYTIVQIGSGEGIRRRAVFFDLGELRTALEAAKPDVIYQQGRLSYTGECARYAKQANIPFFFHIAHEFDLNFRWVTLKYSPNTPFDFTEYVLGMRGIKGATHIIAQTDRQARLLRESLGMEAAAVIRNFQPLPEALPEKPAGPMQVFWVANLKDFKRPHLFVELVESFAGRTDLTFLMAGRPPGGRRFKPLMEKLQTIPNFKYFGELPITQVNQIMNGASVHVNTSSFEGFPNTFLQAWARGAVVASLAVDPDEEGMEKAGIGYCAGSMQRLHAIVDELAKDPQKRQSVAERAFAFVHAQHSLAEAVRLTDLMLNAVGKRVRVAAPVA